MKTLLATLSALSVILASACGSSADNSQVNGLPNYNPPVEQAERTLFAIEGTLGDVAVKSAEAPAQGIWTEVSIDFQVPCTEKLENVAITHEVDAKGQTKILVSAFASAENIAPGPTCQSIMLKTEKVTLPGIVDRTSLTLVNLVAPRTEIPNGTTKVNTLRDVKVVSVRELCEPGFMCIQGGTVVTLIATLDSCANTLGPVAYLANQPVNADNTLAHIQLAVHAVDFSSPESELIRCAKAEKKTFNITLPMMFGDAKDIDLTVLK